MRHDCNRREILSATAGALLAPWALPRAGAEPPGKDSPDSGKGIVVGHPEGARAGMAVLASGGNVIDGIVAAALVAGVVSPHMCGAGGYGGHLVAALDGGRVVTAIDFNSAAPAAARATMFRPDSKGQVKGRVNEFGWLATGVPGTLAGLQLALDRLGSRPLREVARAAIGHARDGFKISTSLAGSIRRMRPRLEKDPGSARLFLPGGEPLKAGRILKNPDLAALLEGLARHGSVEPFYRGDVARQIAGAFKRHGGLVTAEDLAAYRAREVRPLELVWRGFSIRTPPPTAGGLTVLEALAVLKALGWDTWKADAPRFLRARLEALRLVWDDRLRLLGDPARAEVPVGRLLGAEHIKRLAGQVEKALSDGKPARAESDGRSADGTIHLSAADAKGNLAALTLTHGGAFGACVTVPGLGVTLGQGMSRFDPRPDHPNAPGPGKRPLHNMCPTVVLKEGKPVLALGGRGGRRIPNAVFEVLLQFVVHGIRAEEALAAPRLHTEGGLLVTPEPSWKEEELKSLKNAGYKIQRGAAAVVSLVVRDPRNGTVRGASR
jgi:gamma-glutamyltranspeptidase / glutathione hydrolase